MENSNAPVELDSDAEWRQEGRLVTHPRIKHLLTLGLEPRANGWCVRMGDQTLEAILQDTPYYVLGADLPPEGLKITLNDFSEELIPQPTIYINSDHILYCWVKAETRLARFKRKAVHQMSDRLEESQEGFVFRIGERTYPIHPLPDGLPRWREGGQ